MKSATLMVSVVICTHNRVSDLREVVDDLLEQTYDDYEILVVDNASTDETAEYVQEKMKVAPRIRYSRECQQGLSHARNRGIREAKGDIVAYVDDDCRVPPGWISALVSAYRETQADAVGGPAKPKWENSPSKLTLMLFRLGLIPGTYNRGTVRHETDWIVGCNMSFQRTVFDQIDGFRTDVGRMGHRQLSGEEVDLCTRMVQARLGIIYDPAAWVWHKIGRERQSLSFVLRGAFWNGVSNALIGRSVNREAAWRVHPLSVLVNVFSAAGRLYARICWGRWRPHSLRRRK